MQTYDLVLNADAAMALAEAPRSEHWRRRSTLYAGRLFVVAIFTNPTVREEFTK